MAKGYYLVIKDKTTCGGIITEGDPTHTLFGKAIAREQDRVTCGKHPGMFIIVGHIPGDSVNGRKFAGTLHSKSSCPCQAQFIPSITTKTYEDNGGSKQSQTEKEAFNSSAAQEGITGQSKPVSNQTEATTPSKDTDSCLSGWLGYFGTDVKPLSIQELEVYTQSPIPKIIIAGDGHRTPPFIYAKDMPGVIDAFKKNKLRLYVEYTKSDWLRKKKEPGALPECLTQPGGWFQKDIVTPWENEDMAGSSKIIFDMLSKQLSEGTGFSGAEKTILQKQCNKFSTGLNDITPNLATEMRKYITDITSKSSLPDDSTMGAIRIISGKWRDDFVNEDLAKRICQEVRKNPDMTHLISIGDAHLDDKNNPFHLQLATKLTESMTSPPLILVNKSSSYD